MKRKKLTFFSNMEKAYGLLTTSDKRKLVAVGFIQFFLSLLDLIGVALVGAIGALAVTGIQSRAPGDRVFEVLKLLNLENFSFQTQVSIFGITAGLFFISRTIATIFISRKTMFFLSNRSSQLSTEICKVFFSQPYSKIISYKTHWTIYSLTTGIESIVVGTMGLFVLLMADLSLLIVLSVALFVVDPLLAIGTSILFGAIGWIMFSLLHRKAGEVSRTAATSSIAGNTAISELFSVYQELFLRDTVKNVVRKFSNSRSSFSKAQAELTFMPNLNKYVIESAVVIGALAISAVQFTLSDAAHAAGTLAIFIAAGSRIAPAALRLQQGLLQFKANSEASKPSFELITQLESEEVVPKFESKIQYSRENFTPSVTLDGINVRLNETTTDFITNLDFKIDAGEFIALVGPSGGGKSTLINTILGSYVPSKGKALISNLDPLEAFNQYPGCVGYVPQEVRLIEGSLKENVAIGLDNKDIDDHEIWVALDKVGLLDYFEKQPSQLDTLIGAGANALSGGQRQRIGIARALYTSPKLLLLDEATSSLDAQTETAITQTLINLKGKVTLIIAAHRLATIRSADRIYYMSNGAIAGQGTFQDLRSQIPDFDQQAEIQGLTE
jgi:ABC-type multidrug transport system fused ATPase/permease subunit